MEWLGNPLLYVFVSFFGPDRAQRSITFLSFWTYWSIETLHWFIQSQFVNKKQRVVHGQGASNITYTHAPLFSALRFAGFPNQSPLLTNFIWLNLASITDDNTKETQKKLVKQSTTLTTSSIFACYNTWDSWRDNKVHCYYFNTPTALTTTTTLIILPTSLTNTITLLTHTTLTTPPPLIITTTALTTPTAELSRNLASVDAT